MQNALTVIVPVRPGHAAALNQLLADVGSVVGQTGQSRIDFAGLPMIHFARWVLLGMPGDAAGGRCRLAFGTDHDGDDAALLLALHGTAAPLLQEIYAHCEGAPANLADDARAFRTYMLAHRVPFQGRHIAYHSQTVASVKNALALRDAVEEYVDRTRAQNGFAAPGDPARSAREILDFIRDSSPVRPLPSPPDRNPVRRTLMLLAALALIGLLAARIAAPALLLQVVLALVAVLIGGALAFVLTLRAHEARDTRDFTPPPAVIDAGALALGENYVVQNQMTHIVPLKPGWFRRTTLRLVLGAINLLAAVHYTRGALGGIPTIHFARWMIIDGGRELLFFSNFDGSWERYLGDFVDQAHAGLTAVWSNTAGFPPTSGLIHEGASNVDVFKAWTRQYQIPTQVWYSAYPTSTVTNIRNALALRDEIAPLERTLGSPPAPVSPAAGEAAKAWLLRL